MREEGRGREGGGKDRSTHLSISSTLLLLTILGIVRFQLNVSPDSYGSGLRAYDARTDTTTTITGGGGGAAAAAELLLCRSIAVVFQTALKKKRDK